MSNLEFMKKFRPEELCVKEFEHWIVCVRQKQTTLGGSHFTKKRNRKC
ncbi:MAG: hypothetical protein HFJ59_06730 [Clostridia bacterium]|nr:hypothetical protein [Clostridia bacterium]